MPCYFSFVAGGGGGRGGVEREGKKYNYSQLEGVQGRKRKIQGDGPKSDYVSKSQKREKEKKEVLFEVGVCSRKVGEGFMKERPGRKEEGSS